MKKANKTFLIVLVLAVSLTLLSFFINSIS